MVAKKSMKFHRMYLLKGRFINSYILFAALRKVVSKEYMKAGKDAMYVKWTVAMRCADYEVDVTMDGEDHTPLALSVFVKTLLDRADKSGSGEGSMRRLVRVVLD